MSTWQQFRANLRSMKNAEPGHRFQEFFRRQRRLSAFMRWLPAIIGVVIFLAGLFLVPAPGPGWLIVFLGLGLMSAVFRPAARLLDWAEPLARRGWNWLGQRWTQLPLFGKFAIGLATSALLAVTGYAVYYHLVV